jgi:hypothetical protein
MAWSAGLVGAAGGLANFVVFDATTGPNSSVTGGWHYEHSDGGSQVSIGTNADSVYTYAPYWSSGAAVANNNINTTGAVSVTIEAAGTAASYGYAGVEFPGGGVTILADGSVNNRPRTTFVVPVTNGGVGKLRFWAANTYNYCYLYKVVINYV